jgi:predicted Zn-dependent protease
LDHLEKELFGKTDENASAGDRLAKLEAKLSGQGAFTKTNPAPSTVAAASPPSGKGQRRAAQPSVSAPQGAANHSVTSAAGGSTDYQTIVSSIPLDAAAGDYLTQIKRYPNGSVARWKNFPVRIRFPQGTPSSWQSSLDSAAKKWGQYIPLKFVGANDQTDIDTVWTNHLPPGQLGVARLLIANGTPQVILYLLRPTFYPPNLPEKCLHAIYIHEVGHALGIFGHSDADTDIMQAQEMLLATKKGKAPPRVGNISPRDINTLRKIYELPPLPDNYSSSQPTEWATYYR